MVRVYKQDCSDAIEIKCNCCGQTIKKIDKVPLHEDYLHIEKKWNYFSSKDLQIHNFDICESCYDKWCSTFMIPIGQAEAIEIFEDIEDIEDTLYLENKIDEK